MTKKTSFLTAVFWVAALALSAAHDPSAVRFLKRVQRKINRIDSWQSKVTMKHFTIYTRDTLRFSGEVKWWRDAHDPFFGYYLWYSNRPFFDEYYNRGKAYTINHQKKEIFKKQLLDPKKTERRYGPFHGSLTDVFNPVFLRSDSFFTNIIADEDIQISKISHGLCSNDIIIRLHHQVPVKELINDSIWDLDVTWYFRRKARLPYKMTRSGHSARGDFYTEVYYDDIQINSNPTADFFLNYQWPAGYKMVEPDVKKKHHQTTKFIPVKAPTFVLKDINGKTVSLESLKGKVVVLDFWFTTCRPCLKAAPYLDDMARTYGDSGLVVLGMNPYDNAERIRNHFKRRPASYPTLLCTREVLQKFSVSSFPTFLVINRKGDIIYRSTGFSNSLMNELRAVIEKALND